MFAALCCCGGKERVCGEGGGDGSVNRSTGGCGTSGGGDGVCYGGVGDGNGDDCIGYIVTNENKGIQREKANSDKPTGPDEAVCGTIRTTLSTNYRDYTSWWWMWW